MFHLKTVIANKVIKLKNKNNVKKIKNYLYKTLQTLIQIKKEKTKLINDDL